MQTHTSLWKALSVLAVAALATAASGATYTEDFAQADGPPEGWAVISPTVNVESEQLTLAPTAGAEVDTLVGQGGTALWFEDISHVEFDISYPGDTATWPYDHGGLILCAQKPEARYGTQTCYIIDYLALADGNPNEGRFRLGRFVNGAEAGITEAAAAGNVYEGKWEVDLTETTVTFTFNGVEQFTVENTEVPRKGYIGFWAYQVPATNKVAVDNVSVEHTPGPCPNVLTDKVVMTAGKANALLPVRVPVGANETEAYEVAVVSQDPAIATVLNSPLVFDAGGPILQYAEIAPGVPGQTRLSLEVAGEDCSGVTVIAETLRIVAFEEDFTQDDGLPEGWYIASTTAQVINNELSLSAPGQPFCWYAIDGEPLNVPKMESVTCMIKFAQAALPVGAHGGIYIAPQTGTARSTGYMIDVIERESDNGFRIYKDNNAGVQLGGPRQPYVWDDQWHEWKIEFTPTGFTFTVDGGDDEGEANVNVEDLTYRGGYVSFWCYTGAAGQNMFVDDIRIEIGASACPKISPLSGINRPVNAKTVYSVAKPINPSRTEEYSVTVTSTDPAVAIPVGAVDGSLVLTWPVDDDSATKTFEAECLTPGTTEFILDGGGVSCILNQSATFTVREPGERGFCDDFSQADGPPENWTPWAGGGNPGAASIFAVAGEQLTMTDTTAGEAWIWAGNPSPRIEGAQTISFTMQLAHPDPANAVGKHGGVMFCANEPSHRWVTSGYEIDWIDRTTDRGYRFLRSDNGVHTVIAGPTFEAFDLGTQWKIEFDGDTIKVTVDDVEIFNIVDATYREGHFGLWVYRNGTTAVYDDIVVGECGPKFLRGDTDGNGIYTLGDGVQILERLFANREAFTSNCEDAGDLDDSGNFTIGDAIWLFNFIFATGELKKDPFPPYPLCGLDPTPDDELGCLGDPANICPTE
ncbi:MAG: hypothetical protein JXP34_03300 [Planctomycetes bacterium]|nr:hypothetical protein [Planctomycetota bacterium]